MRSKIQMWGNSLALRIPRAFALDAKLEQDSEVDVTLVNGQIVITPIPAKSWRLDELLEEVTGDNLHGETETGDAVGMEVW
jgi:antitoxin MazE